ncbi:hypothetical protein GmHk_18G052568 [Glycine max]|nr:hypothetical protein GmHk_18G052568 [Glycine max]
MTSPPPLPMVQLSHALLRGSFGSCSVGAFVGEKNHGPTNAEKAIGYEHGLVVPEVPILGYVLGTDDDGVGVGVNLKHVFCELNGDDVGAAAHAAKVEAFDITAELVLVDDHGGEGRGAVEEAAVDDKDADVFGVDKGEARRREREVVGHQRQLEEARRRERKEEKISYFFILSGVNDSIVV